MQAQVFYEDQEKRTKFFVSKINQHASAHGYDFELVTIGSIFWISFDGKKRIQRADQIDSDMTPFRRLFAALLERGIYIGPSGYEVGFVSQSHSEAILENAAERFCEALDSIMLD